MECALDRGGQLQRRGDAEVGFQHTAENARHSRSVGGVQDRAGGREPAGLADPDAKDVGAPVRVRVEHIFGAQSNDMGGTLVRSIGVIRAKARIGLKNLAYNMRRLVQLEHLATAPP